MRTTGIDVGIDFGTSNTAVSIFAPGEGPQVFRLDGVDGDVHAPTVIESAEGRRGAISKSAILAWLSGDRPINRHFKHLLGQSGRNAFARKSSKDFKAAHRFLKEVITRVKESNAGESIRNLAIGVPEAWLTGGELDGRDAVSEILKELGIHEPIIVSEPVAAACTFAHRYKERHSKDYAGYVLVYDHGGGTLDLRLVRFEDGNVFSVDGIGLALDVSSHGAGGVAFDEQVFERQAAREPALARYNRRQRDTWLHEFEEKKRQLSIEIQRALAARDTPGAGPWRMEVGDSLILLDDIVSAFEDELAPKIEATLDTFIANCCAGQPSLSLADPETFRVVMVGGFSEFCLVRHLVERVLARQAGSAELLDDSLSRDERWHAVAHGACLLAGGAVQLQEGCPYTFGLVSFKGREPRYHALTLRGAPLKEYSAPRYLKTKFRTAFNPKKKDHQHLVDGPPSLQFFFERGGRRLVVTGTRDLKALLPEYGRADYWTVAGMADETGVYLAIKPNRGRARRIRVSRLANISDGKYSEEIID